MNKWQVQPEDWKYLPNRKRKRLFKTGVRLAGGLMVVLILASLMIEAKLGF
jgi:hypothetical protein